MLDFLYGAILFIILYATTANFGFTLYGSKLMFAFLFYLIVMLSYFGCLAWWFVYNMKEILLGLLRKIEKLHV